MKIFVDTGAWIALHDRHDQFHKQAIEARTRIEKEKIEMVTSDFIFDESMTFIRYRTSHAAAVLFGSSLLQSSIVTMVSVDRVLLNLAFELFRKYKDQDFSLTDCTSFVLMKRLKLETCFTFDSHFSHVGFRIL
ncbi:MAG: PIN domain-containing protein [Desulfuromonadales bacterium]